MGVVIFSDVHADSGAIGALASCIRSTQFRQAFGIVDAIVNLGDLLHRGDRPRETLERIQALSHEYPLHSVLGNHDHAFLNGILVSGSDPSSMYRHEQIRTSPLLSLFDAMPMEWSDCGMLFVHGGPLDIGMQTLRLKCWQRLSHESGDSFAGYNYTAEMAFDALADRGLVHMCCGHQHQNICCRKTGSGIIREAIHFLPVDGEIGQASVALDVPTLLRVGGCHGEEPEFAYTDYSTFSFIRIQTRDW